MELNFFTIVYLFFRLAPFVIVCFFTLQSIFNQDFRGIIYLVGLIFACVFTTLIGAIPGFQYLVEDYGLKMPANVKQVCRLIELGNGVPISYIPLGQTVLAYTFIYLVYIIVNHNLIMQNIPTFVIFPVLIVADMIWNVSNSCSSIALLFLSMITGGGIGALWAYIIDSTGKANLQLFNGISSQSVCSRPSKQVLRCKPVSQPITSVTTTTTTTGSGGSGGSGTGGSGGSGTGGSGTGGSGGSGGTVSKETYDTALNTIMMNSATSRNAKLDHPDTKNVVRNAGGKYDLTLKDANNNVSPWTIHIVNDASGMPQEQT